MSLKRKKIFCKFKRNKQLALKRISYGEFVNKIHKPIVCPKKKLEMEHMINRLKHPAKQIKKFQNSLNYNQLYNVNGEHPWNSVSQITNGSRRTPSNIAGKLLKDHNDFNRAKSGSTNHMKIKSSVVESEGLKTLNSAEKESLIEAKTEIQNSTLNDRTETLPKKIIISKKATHKHRKKNAGVRKDKNKRYSPKRLKKKKINNINSKRIENASALSRDKYRQWDSEAHINKISKSTNLKADKIRNLANIIESKAHQKEEILNAMPLGFNVEETIEVNDMYISAIKAKLALLEVEE